MLCLIKKTRIMWEMYVIYNKKNLITEIQLIRFIIVTATGFKPVTPTSVVWYSIQLSYAAIFCFCECKDSLFIYNDKTFYGKS